MTGQSKTKPLGVADHLNALTLDQLTELRQRFREIPDWGEQAHPRIAITAALNEACHLAFSGYNDCRDTYDKLRERCTVGKLDAMELHLDIRKRLMRDRMERSLDQQRGEVQRQVGKGLMDR